MTTVINLATSDGHIRSSSTVYSSASGTGLNLTVEATAVTWRFGQNKIGSTYEIHEAFVAFPYTLDANAVVVTAYVDLDVVSTTGTGVARDLGMREFVWTAGGLTTGDWRSLAAGINALTRYGYAGGIQGAADDHIYATEGLLNDLLLTTGAKEFVIYNSRMTGLDVPAGAEYTDVNAVESASSDPALVYTTVPRHTLLRVAGCQTQLSDGQHVYIDAADGDYPAGLLTLKRFDGTTHTNIATNLLAGSRDMGSSNQAQQSYALIRDASDNIYWIGHSNGGGNTLNVVTWKKTGTNAWTEQPFRQTFMPTAPGTPTINNIAAAWHNIGFSGGTILVVVSRDCTSTDGTPTDEVSYALLNCQYLLTGVGSLLKNSGDAFTAGLISPYSRSQDFNMPVNPVGTCLDVCALDSTRGVVVSLDRASEIGDFAPIGIIRYILNSTGTGFAQTNQADETLWSTKDAGAKARVLPISSTRFAVVTLDMDSGWGPTIYVIQNVGTSSTFSTLGSVLLGGETIASLPAPGTLHDKAAWDVIHHPDANAIYFYYIDAVTGSGLRLMRTTFNLATYQATRDEIQVQAAVGAAGSTNHAIRVQRGVVTKSEAMVTVANKTSGNVQSTVYIKDTLNVAPLAPTLVDKLNYDATTGSLFDWVFNDLNVGDTQSAYEFQIDNADTLASVIATGKVTSTATERNVVGATLTNGINYRWRVRTWDASDLVGAWSTYDFFTTSAGGSLNITSPATDNPAGIIRDDYTFVWSVTGMTQIKYRVRVVNNTTGVQISDTGFLTSTATSHTVTGMASDVEHRVEITAQNAAVVNTNTATRLITPNYNEPEIPLASVSAQNDAGHILVDVVNPTPQGDRPEVTYNLIQRRRAGESAWITVATVVANGSYQDWHTGSGVEYEYQILAVASIGQQVSTVYSATPALMGVWMHLPSNPSGTALNLMFGANQRGDTISTYAELVHYAGRQDPVADFAFYQDRTFNVVVDIPYGDNYYTQLDALDAMITSKQTMVYRDNRRRNAFGTVLSGLNKSDTSWGTQATFDFTKVDYNEEVV